ncbi:MAG: ribokinase [candidate division Zixibacteria bacterium]|nr:ribokinase [candidate division Zixibacteria bacterium]
MITAIGNPVFDLIQTPKIKTDQRVLSGCSTNAVLALNRLGARTKLIGAVGEDFRESFTELMDKRGIETLIIPSEKSGGFSLDYYDDYGNRTLDLIDRAENIGALDPKTYRDSQAILIGPILGEISFDLLCEIRKNFDGLFFCDPQGLLRSADQNGRIEHHKPDGIEEILGLFDIVKPNELEGKVLTGIDCRENPHRAAREIHSWGCKIVLLTLAELGAVVYDGSTLVDIPPDQIKDQIKGMADIPACEVNLIDSTGAGDTSMAGFTFEYLNLADKRIDNERNGNDSNGEQTKGKNIVAAACFAAATSSIMIENMGPDFEMTEAMVRARADVLRSQIDSGYNLELSRSVGS